MMLGRRKEEPKRTFLDRKCLYFSVKLIKKKEKKSALSYLYTILEERVYKRTNP